MNDFDTAAKEAEKMLPDDLNDLTATELAKWFSENFMTAGHKRLGRILVKRAKLAVALVA